MTALAERLWPALAAAGLLGALFSLMLGPGRSGPSATGAGRLLALAVFAGIAAVAWAEAVPGRPGLWLDTAVLALGAYGLGTALGLAARRLDRRRWLPGHPEPASSSKPEERNPQRPGEGRAPLAAPE